MTLKDCDVGKYVLMSLLLASFHEVNLFMILIKEEIKIPSKKLLRPWTKQHLKIDILTVIICECVCDASDNFSINLNNFINSRINFQQQFVAEIKKKKQELQNL